MNAIDLIELLKAHPKACEALGLTLDIGNRWTSASDGQGVWFSDIDVTGHDRSSHHQTPRFRRWLLGAAQEWADEHRYAVHQDRDCPDVYIRTTGQFSYETHPTRLHALLAAMEATEQQAK